MDNRAEFFTRRLKRDYSGEVLSKAVDRVIENQDRYYALLRSTEEPGIEDLIASIHRSNFFFSRSHSHHHYATGLVEHSLGVYDQMHCLAKDSDLAEKNIILTALLHDVCMARNKDWPQCSGHGAKSCRIVEQYLPDLPPAVKEAITKHRHTPEREDAERNPLWAAVRTADIADSATSPGRALKFLELEHQEEIMDKQFNKWRIMSLLKSTGRPNIDRLIYGIQKVFFDAPASKNYHNAFRGGLAKHSLDVYNEAMELNKSFGLPEDSVTICALLHDICKYDQYYIDHDGRPQRNEQNITKGHGLRSKELIEQYGVDLSLDEKMAIWWHMGQYEPSKADFPQVYEEASSIPLCQLLQKADGIAAAKGMN